MRDINAFSDLIGETCVAVNKIDGNDGDELRFELQDGRAFRLFHYRACCETVSIEDICGSLDDLVGSPLTQADESTFDTHPYAAETITDYVPPCQTWTFYRMATAKGSVVIRWYGSSNGYYSKSVDFAQVDAG